MNLVLLSFGAGMLTVLSPCVLPILPFVFARPGSIRLFGGLAFGFAAVMLLAVAGGSWAVTAHEAGRSLAMVLLAGFGLVLAWPSLAARLGRPLQGLAGRLDRRAAGAGTGSGSGSGDALLGLSTGLLWAPCAGPVLGLVLTGAALHGGTSATLHSLIAYAAGAASTLIVVRLLVSRAGRRLPTWLRATAPVAGGTSRLAGVAVLAGVLLVATGLDARLAVALPGLGLDALEQRWLDVVAPSTVGEPAPQASQEQAERAMPSRTAARMQPTALSSTTRDFMPRTALLAATEARLDLPVLGTMPPLAGATTWLQSPPLRAEDLRGKVVLVDFWTFGCINCQRAIPSVRDWARRYRDDGLVVVGVHAPEFAFERDQRNVERALKRRDLDFPIAMDNDFAIWNAWSNRYWPTLYLVDAQGRVRWRHIGEGAYAQTEQALRQLLDEARARGGAAS